MSSREGGRNESPRKPRLLPLVAALLTLIPNGSVIQAAAQTVSAPRATPAPVLAAAAAASTQSGSSVVFPAILTLHSPSASAPAPFAPTLTSLPQAAAGPSAAEALPAETLAMPPSALQGTVRGNPGSDILPTSRLQEAKKTFGQNPGSTSASDKAAGDVLFDGSTQRSGTIKNPAAAETAGASARTNIAARIGEAALRGPARNQRLKDLRHLLGDGTETASGVIGRFSFLSPDGKTWTPALSAGLEGFFYSKRSHEATHGAARTLTQIDDYFNYLNELLSPVAWTNDLRRELREIQTSPAQSDDKNRRLDDFLLKTVSQLRAELMSLDKAQWGRSASIYMILSRAYNRIKTGPDGKPLNFFDSIDAEEFARIRRETNSNTVWVLDMFEIGEINRWGSAGGSPYAIKGYTVKEELGGAEAFKRFVKRAHEQGMKVMVDYIPNHTSLDSGMMTEHPEAFLHVVPPQPDPSEPLEAYKKRVQDAAPRFHLLKVARYPEGNHRVPKWILVQHPYQGGDFSFTWLDMAQIDYTHPAARAYRLREARRIFSEYGVDGIRRDMSYFVLNQRFYKHWLGVLEWERDQAQGWMRENLSALIVEFKARQNALGNREYLEEMMSAIRNVNPEAFQIDEAYEEFEALSRSGSHARYNKVGLYDAMVSRNPDWIRGALGELVFRSWQRGGAGLVNFVGTHDAGEGNPVDKLGAQFRPALAMAMAVSPTLTYNGLELGTGQSRMLQGDLSQSRDTEKAIPFDVKVKINWNDPDEANKEFFRLVTDFSRRNQPIIQGGAMDVLAPREATPIVAYSAGRRDADGRQRAILVASNFGQNRAAGVFRFSAPLLKEFGAFEPRADKKYVLRDFANLDQNGSPTLHVRTGRQLLDEGLFILLPAGGAHLFEVEELDLNSPSRAPPAVYGAAAGFAAPQGPVGAIGRTKIFLTRPGKAPVEAALTGIGELLAADAALREELNATGKVRVVLAKAQPEGSLSTSDLEAVRAILKAEGVHADLEVETIAIDWKRESEHSSPEHGASLSGQEAPRSSAGSRILRALTLPFREAAYLTRALLGSLSKPTRSEVLGGIASKAFPFIVSAGVWAKMYEGHPIQMIAATALSLSLDTFHGIWINSWSNLQNALYKERGLRYQTVFNFIYGQLWGIVYRSLAWTALAGTVPPWSLSYWKDVGLSTILGTFFGTLGYQGLNTLYNNGRLSRWQRSAIQQIRDLGFMLAGTFFGAGSMTLFWTVFAAQQTLDFAIYLLSRHAKTHPILYVADEGVAATGKFQGLYPVQPGAATETSPLKQALGGILKTPFVKPFVWLYEKILRRNSPNP